MLSIQHNTNLPSLLVYFSYQTRNLSKDWQELNKKSDNSTRHFSIVLVNNLLSSPICFTLPYISLLILSVFCSSQEFLCPLQGNLCISTIWLPFYLYSQQRWQISQNNNTLCANKKTVVFFSVIQQINNNEHNVVHVTTFAHIFQLITHESFSFYQVSFLCHSYFGLINDVLVFTFLSSPFQNSVSSKTPSSSPISLTKHHQSLSTITLSSHHPLFQICCSIWADHFSINLLLSWYRILYVSMISYLHISADSPQIQEQLHGSNEEHQILSFLFVFQTLHF